jgi:hypothetical protein
MQSDACSQFAGLCVTNVGQRMNTSSVLLKFPWQLATAIYSRYSLAESLRCNALARLLHACIGFVQQ